MSITIKTNHQFRPLLKAYELTKKELREFDYMTNDELLEADFIRYRGQVYALNDFVCIIHKGQSAYKPFAHFDHDDCLKEWDGIRTDSFFSGIVIKYSQDFETVKVGLALS